ARPATARRAPAGPACRRDARRRPATSRRRTRAGTTSGTEGGAGETRARGASRFARHQARRARQAHHLRQPPRLRLRHRAAERRQPIVAAALVVLADGGTGALLRYQALL